MLKLQASEFLQSLQQKATTLMTQDQNGHNLDSCV